MDDGSGSTPESKPLKQKNRLRLKEVLIAKNWLVDIFAGVADAALLVLQMKGLTMSFEFGMTRLVIYAIQAVLAILLSGRPRPKSAYLSEALQVNL